MKENNDLMNVTKYLLNYLFKKIDDLQEENLKLKLMVNIKEAEDNFLKDLADRAVVVAKKMGLIEEEDDKEHSETDDRKA